MSSSSGTTSSAARADPRAYFSDQEIDRARSYHRPMYASFLGSTLLSLIVLVALAFSPLGEWLAAPVDDLPRWAFALGYSAILSAFGSVIALPLRYWRGFVYEHRWGFSTQTRGAWFVDWAKASAVQLLLNAALLLLFVEIAATFHRWWPVVASLGVIMVVVVLSFLAPVVFEPIFNKFRPLGDAGLVESIRALGRRAGTPVRDVLVADASRRTKKENAYVSGLGATRRVVVYDTLLSRGTARDVELVVAHELGHRRDRHVVWGTALAAAGAVVAVLLLRALLRSHAVLDAIDATGASDPRAFPFVLFVISVLELVSMPVGVAVSRRWERAADRASIELTDDPDGFVTMEHDLAVANLSDLDPPRALYLMVFTHPSPPERIAAALNAKRPTTG